MDRFPENLGSMSDEQGERFHQDIKEMETWYQGRYDPRSTQRWLSVGVDGGEGGGDGKPHYVPLKGVRDHYDAPSCLIPTHSLYLCPSGTKTRRSRPGVRINDYDKNEDKNEDRNETKGELDEKNGRKIEEKDDDENEEDKKRSLIVNKEGVKVHSNPHHPHARPQHDLREASPSRWYVSQSRQGRGVPQGGSL
ncbi:hypothetical protein O3P69_017339 [Scylla paramamosain]|uniref:Uncharacterized protein n=1 Tax=Scylla paramamosain TaxID=85552 RepID=A0AAW0TZZ9_SCYPA